MRLEDMQPAPSRPVTTRGPSPKEGSGRMASRRIDIHTHAMSEAVMGVLGSRGFAPTGGYKISVRWTPEAASAYMDRQGIAAQVVSMPMALAGSDDEPQFGKRVWRL